MTPELLNACTGCGLMVAETWAPSISQAMARASITTPFQIASFLAQIAHESGGFTIWAENMNYSATGLLATWPTHFTAAQAQAYAHQPVRIGNYVYSNACAGKDLGNGDEASGDGYKFRGHFLMQLTGHDDYRDASAYVGVDLLANPDAITDMLVSAETAGWEWTRSGCNALADAQNFHEMTERINGAQIGAVDRVRLLNMGLKAYSLQPWEFQL